MMDEKRSFLGPLKVGSHTCSDKLGQPAGRLIRILDRRYFGIFCSDKKGSIRRILGSVGNLRIIRGSWHPYRSAVLAWEKRRPHVWLI